MSKKNKPEPLYINGGLVDIEDSPPESGFNASLVTFQNMDGGLSPYEAEELRNWLNGFLEWYYHADVSKEK